MMTIHDEEGYVLFYIISESFVVFLNGNGKGVKPYSTILSTTIILKRRANISKNKANSFETVLIVFLSMKRILYNIRCMCTFSCIINIKNFDLIIEVGCENDLNTSHYTTIILELVVELMMGQKLQYRTLH